MPIVKYRCTDCDKEFAKIFVTPEKAPSECPVCGSGNLQDMGQAFQVDIGSFQRLSCSSCDTCGDDVSYRSCGST